jgi:hypothetical protein
LEDLTHERISAKAKDLKVRTPKTSELVIKRVEYIVTALFISQLGSSFIMFKQPLTLPQIFVPDCGLLAWLSLHR